MEKDQVIDAFSAIAQPTRMDAYKLIVMHEPDGIAAGEVSRILDVPQNTMSTHLAILSRAGLISSERPTVRVSSCSMAPYGKSPTAGFWISHLKWLDDNIQAVRAIKLAEAGWSLAAWEE